LDKIKESNKNKAAVIYISHDRKETVNMKMTGSLNHPPMGWNSYDYFDTTVNEKQVKENADYMARYLKQYGWEYIVVDIAWYSKQAGQAREKYQYVPFADLEMDEYSRLLPDENRFPSSKDSKGFKPLADYVHDLGLKFGIHIMRGIPRIAAYKRTKIKGTSLTANEVADPYSICPWNPDMYGVDPKSEGSQKYYDSLLELYSFWGVDFIKCDDICRMDAESAKEETQMLHRAIQNCGRDIVLSLSPGPAILTEHEFYKNNANMWRMTDDFWDSWGSLRDMFDRCRQWQPYVADNAYPDCDMLPIGMLGKGFGQERKTNFTIDEQKTMITLWCIFRSPLMIGANLTLLDDETHNLLTNERIYEMARNIRKSKEVYKDDDFIVWEGRSEDRIYTAVFNISDRMQHTMPVKIREGSTEMWSGKTFDTLEDVSIPPHGVIAFSI
jgi:hypothetical protein